MAGKVIPWSYSSLTSFENCPRQFAELRIHKTTERIQYEAAKEGADKHKEIELYLKGEAPLADKTLRDRVQMTLADLSRRYLKYEVPLAITEDGKSCEWDAPNCWHRGILDVLYVDDTPNAHIFDWKFGKVDEYSQQLRANAMTVFAHYPHVECVYTNYVWITKKRLTQSKVFREFKGKVRDAFGARVTRMEKALENNDWPENPSGLCKKHCPVATCQYNGVKHVSE